MAPTDSDILKIVKEDILRILGQERGKQASLELIDSEIKVSDSFLPNAVKELEKEGLLRLRGNLLPLTKRGQKVAAHIIEKHLVLESYFKRTRSEEEAHKAAHVLEHYVSEEVIDNIRKLSTFREEGVPLTKFGLGKKGMVGDITLSNDGLFERVVSMGICPGEGIKVTGEIPGGLIVMVENKKLALGKDIARGIKVVEHEKA